MTWKTAVSFVVFATLLTILTGWLIAVGGLPIQESLDFGDGEMRVIQTWLRLALPIGLILPGIAFFAGIKHPQLRQIFGFYFLVLLVQIFTELIVVRVWISSLVVLIGTIYTAFRVWQLWQGLKLATKIPLHRFSDKLIRGLLWLLLLFWSSNLMMLLTVAWPSIV
ncbi:MAG: hypothetical protein EA343_12590 [Nodularia sp. (in: Bacteria)]|nr:MAG: hypothetical protein EA343_12590 [Nodularia sp. (in: cyanobacteria)]